MTEYGSLVPYYLKLSLPFFMEPKSKASRRKIDLAPELVSEWKKWKLASPKGGLDLLLPTEDGTSENVANLLYRRFFPTPPINELDRMQIWMTYQSQK